MKHLASLTLAALLLAPSLVLAEQPVPRVHRLTPAPTPADNPLKGLVPYSSANHERFPHSMEFDYLPLGDLVVDADSFDWQPLEKRLDAIAGRGHQAVFRVWLEYPGHANGIPRFLEEAGVKVTEWLNTNTAPLPHQKVRTPDYSDPRLRAALASFIAALGRKYDGDPRIGFITAGLLGTWGEWHTFPRNELMADKTVQSEVMDAYERAFRKTPVLLRYPAGESTWSKAPNQLRHFGYHDDSFAWATLDTGRKEDDWFFVPALKSAGSQALEKWKTYPIGGEIRPELWGQIFDEKPSHKQAQDFAACVRETHVTWLMDSGMFEKPATPQRQQRAIEQVRLMGYDFQVQTAGISRASGKLDVRLSVINQGVAPFYYDWRLELAALDAQARVTRRWPLDWKLTGLCPGDLPREWKTQLDLDGSELAGQTVALRVINPLANGKPLRFANAEQDQLAAGWLSLGTLPAAP
jgi:hypothetical protein